MTDTILVAVAWPYANAEIHVGNLAGSYLPADIFARYQRLRGRKVLMVSGSDAHGTPITVRADAEKTTALAVYQRFHAGFLTVFQQLGLTYDLFTSTHTRNHMEVAHQIFLALKQGGYLYLDSQQQWYSTAQGRFLPDRYVEGTCYICGFTNARSDQCDNCGNLLEPGKLIDPRSKIDGSTPELRLTSHYFLDLGKLQDQVVTFLKAREGYWRPNVLRQSLGQIEVEPLRGRPITRDLDWGIPIPREAYPPDESEAAWQTKCLYVWFEAVIGYLSATIEWSKINEDEGRWRDWWVDPDARSYYFIGKDNIPFHAVIWPAELMGLKTGFDEVMRSSDPKPMVLPYDVPANEFMNLEGKKISGSQNWAVWGLDALDRYDSDALRYYLTVAMPENRDTDWDWEEFFQRNNNELVATWGNLVNRVLSFTWKNFEGKIPNPGQLRASDLDLLDTIKAGFELVGSHIEKVELKAALAEAMRLATEVNKYLDVHAPWFEIKTDRNEAAKSLFTAIQAIDWLKIMFAPFLPNSSERLHQILAYEKSLFGTSFIQEVSDSLGSHQVLCLDNENSLVKESSDSWLAEQLAADKPFNQPAALYKKLDHSIVEEERSRLGKPSD